MSSSPSPDDSLAQAQAILDRDPADPGALRAKAAALRSLGRGGEAAEAELKAIQSFNRVPELARAARLIAQGDHNDAERLLRPWLARRPDDPAALLMLADIASAMGFFGEAERLLLRALERAPGFGETRQRLATVLLHQNRAAESLDALDALLKLEPGNLQAAVRRAATLAQLGDYGEAERAYDALLARSPGDPRLWAAKGHLMKTVGRTDDGVRAFRRAIAIDPASGEAWWGLANIKTMKLGEEDRRQVRRALERAAGSRNEPELHFALGKALEDEGAYEESFRHYSSGNRLRRAALPYDAAAAADEVRRTEAVFTRPFFAARAGQGDSTPGPIFVLGMPRAGSTLVEQILASHSAVEGTSELPHVPILIQQLIEEGWRGGRGLYPELVAGLPPDRVAALGHAYLQAAALHRKTSRPLFIDKLPNNWLNLGLIRLALPNARIVDVRREPLDCCFSNFKQSFAQGQAFSYDLADLGAYYRDYVGLMAHFDATLPGAVHRVIYEDLVADPEKEVRRLLEHLDLPFEEGCLRFHENRRAVRTASAEQVRRPINREGMGQWRAYEPWLAPLKAALGPALEDWRKPSRPSEGWGPGG